MKKILIVLLGKSGSGKDTLLQALVNTGCKRLVTHTTRPMRPGEKEGVDYYFHSDEEHTRLKYEGKILEEREYETTMGTWYYWTGSFKLTDPVTVTVSTPDGLSTLNAYLMNDEDAKVVPVYLDVSDAVRMERLLAREEQKANPDYKEICRRFITDARDFSDDNIKGVIRCVNDNEENLAEILHWLKSSVYA